MEHHDKHGLSPLAPHDRTGVRPADHMQATPRQRQASRVDPAEHDRGIGDNPRGVEAAVRDLCAFETLVRETGLIQFCQAIKLVRRQVNRMLSGAQPNPINRMIATIHAAESKAARRAMQYLCDEIGGSFIPAGTNNDPQEQLEDEALRVCAVAANTGLDADPSQHPRITQETITNARRALDRLQSHPALSLPTPDHAAADPSSR